MWVWMTDCPNRGFAHACAACDNCSPPCLTPTFSGLLLAGRARLLAGAAPLPQLSQLEGDKVPHQPRLHEANGRQAVDSAKTKQKQNIYVN